MDKLEEKKNQNRTKVEKSTKLKRKLFKIVVRPSKNSGTENVHWNDSHEQSASGRTQEPDTEHDSYDDRKSEKRNGIQNLNEWSILFFHTGLFV